MDSIAYWSHGVHGEKKSHGCMYTGATCLIPATSALAIGVVGMTETVCHNAWVKGYAVLPTKVS